MIERDFFLRQISLLAQALAKVLLHKRAFEFPQAKREIDAAYKTLLGASADFIRQFSDEQLIEMFHKDVETAAVKFYIIGVLLKEEAEVLQVEKKEDESRLYQVKSLSLLLASFNDLGTPLEPNHPTFIEELIRQLCEIDLPANVKEKVLAFYESTGRYGKAEDVLFELIEIDERFREVGIQFYERLLKKHSDELERGGLPRAEIFDGMKSLNEITAL